jgi:hypothetical protein
MQNNLVRKGLVLGIVVLFVGLIIIPSIGSSNVSIKLKNTSKQATLFNPFLKGWLCRKKITIDHNQVAGDLNDFPVLINIVNSDLAAKAQDDGDDIIFMDDKGKANQLSHEIEFYDGSTGELIAWINIPFVSSTSDTIFYMYFKNRKCDNQQNVEGTWNDNYLAVYHMNDIENGIKDSTSNDRHGYELGNPSYQQDGVIGNSAIDFDGINDGFGIPNDFGLYHHDFTVECWAKFDSYQTSTKSILIFLHGEICAKLAYRSITNAIDWEVRFVGEYYWDYINIVKNPSDITNFHYYAGSVDHNNVDTGLYDGNIVGIQNNEVIDIHTQDNSIGIRIDQNSKHFDGLMDEVRISNNVRSQEWIETTYNSISNSSGFITPSSTTTHFAINNYREQYINNLYTFFNNMRIG